MNRVLQGRRQLLMEVRRLGSYRGYDTLYLARYEFCCYCGGGQGQYYPPESLRLSAFLIYTYHNIDKKYPLQNR